MVSPSAFLVVVQTPLYYSLLLADPPVVCPQLFYHSQNMRIFHLQFPMLVTKAVVFEGMFSWLCQVFMWRVGMQHFQLFTLAEGLEAPPLLKCSSLVVFCSLLTEVGFFFFGGSKDSSHGHFLSLVVFVYPVVPMW